MRLLPEVVFCEGCYFSDRAVTISGGRITGVAPLAPDEAHAPDTVQLPGKALLPGTVNTHCHTFQSLLRGLGDDLDFMQWRDRVLYPYSTRLDREGIYLGAAFAFAEMLLHGVTTCVDFFYLQDEGNENAEAVIQAARDTGIELAIIRPPLVHGPGVRANFRALLRLVASGVPLPFAAIDNRRSLIFVENLVDLLAEAAVDPAAAGQVLLAADGTDLSTPQMIRVLATGLGRPARLFAVPKGVFTLLRPLPVLGPPLARLTLSLQVDDGATRARLGWRPAISAEEGLTVTARAFAGR